MEGTNDANQTNNLSGSLRQTGTPANKRRAKGGGSENQDGRIVFSGIAREITASKVTKIRLSGTLNREAL
jgi:hypothetical protein